MEVTEIQTQHDWIVFLWLKERQFGTGFALGMELAMASHLDPGNRLLLRIHGYFKDPDLRQDVQRAQGYDYGCLIVDQLYQANPKLVQDLISKFPSQAVKPRPAL
jgi:hypothetical protein